VRLSAEARGNPVNFDVFPRQFAETIIAVEIAEVLAGYLCLPTERHTKKAGSVKGIRVAEATLLRTICISYGYDPRRHRTVTRRNLLKIAVYNSGLARN
jgi:hypothetical protein